jgi:hypothetical protein
MFEILGIRGNSVRVKCGLFIINVSVIEQDGKKIVRLPEGVYAHNFRTLVGIVLAAHSKGEITTHESKETITLH